MKFLTRNEIFKGNLKKVKIHALARVVALTDEFSGFIIKNP